MILGHAARVAAKLAIANSTPVQKISVETVVRTLKEHGAIMGYVPSGQAPAILILRKMMAK